MNCDKAKINMLLAASGELDEAERSELDGHVAQCASCRDQRAFQETVSREARRAVMSEGPSAATLAAIMARGANARKVPAGWGRLRLFSPVAASWLAAAAALAVVVGVWQFSVPRPALDTTLVANTVTRNDVADMNALVGIAGGNEPDGDVPEDGSSEAVVEDLARELLIYQGFDDSDAWGGAEATESDA